MSQTRAEPKQTRLSTTPQDLPPNGARIARGGLGVRFIIIWIALVALLIIGGFLNPDSLSKSALADLLFFGSLLALIALGQNVVVAGGGIDLSVGAQLTLGALIFAYVARESELTRVQLVAAASCVGACICCGFANGVAVAYLRVSPLIATLSISSIVAGFAYSVPGATGALQVPNTINDLAIAKPIFGLLSRGTIGTGLIALLLASAYRWYAPARKLTLLGDNPIGASARGIPVKPYRVTTYLIASLIYGLAALWLAGLANTPGITLGEPYLLSSIAAVAIAGNSLGGGRSSVTATVGGAFFMTQLGSFSLSLQAPVATQLVVEGAIIAIGMALYTANFASLAQWLRFSRPSRE